MNVGNVIYGGRGSGGSSITNEGTGVPLVDGSAIRSLKEITGVKIAVSGTGKEVDFSNRLNYFFVDQYGAKGDGVTDDTIAIQACFTAAGTATGTSAVVFFPAGTYLVSGVITIPNKQITVLGGGGWNYVSVIKTSFDGNVLSQPAGGLWVEKINIQSTVASPTAGAFILAQAGLTVRDCTFVGGFDQVNCPANIYTSIERTGFIGPTNYAVELSNPASPDSGDAGIINNYFNENGIFSPGFINIASSGGERIVGNKFLCNAFVGAAINVTTPNQTSVLLIANNSIEGFTSGGIIIQASGAAFAKIAIVGNEIDSLNRGGIGIGLVGTNNLSEISITGNLIGNCTTGIEMQGNVTDVTLAANRFFNSSVTDVARVGGATTVLTAFCGDDNAAPPVNPVTPAKYTDVVIFTAAGPVTYKMELFL